MQHEKGPVDLRLELYREYFDVSVFVNFCELCELFRILYIIPVYFYVGLIYGELAALLSFYSLRVRRLDDFDLQSIVIEMLDDVK